MHKSNPLRLALMTLTAAVGIAASSFASAQTRQAVTIEIAPETLAAYPAGTREQVIHLKKHLEATLFSWQEFPVQPPTSTFSGEEFIPLSQLIIAPNSGEVAELGGLAFSAEQIDQIKRQGIFVIPSKAHPDQNHVWQVSFLIQSGSENIRIQFQDLQQRAAKQITVQIPRTFLGRDYEDGPTFFKAFRNTFAGIVTAFDSVLGSRRVQKAYSNDDVARLLNEEFLRLNPSTSPLDNPELQMRFLPELDKITKNFLSEWAGGLEAERKALHFARESRKTADPAELALRIGSLLEYDLNYTLVDRVAQSDALAQIAPNLQRQLADRLQANFMTSDFEDAVRGQLEVMRVEIAERIRSQYPHRSKIRSWFDLEVEKAFQAYYRKTRRQIYAELPLSVEIAGLPYESARLKKMLHFFEIESAQLGSRLREAKTPLRTFSVNRTIWNPNNWSTSFDEKAQTWSHHESAPNMVSTRWPLWRVWLFTLRSRNYLLNGLHGIAKTNFINGPVGLRSLFGAKDFYARKTIDPLTGKLVNDERSLTKTMITRWQSITADIETDLERAKSTANRGILSEKANLVLANIRYRYVKQAFYKSGLLIGQPAVTACNAVASAALCASSPVWAPLRAGLQWASNMLIYDFDSTDARSRNVAAISPLLQGLILKTGILGIGQGAVSFLRTVAHLGMAVGTEATAATRAGALTTKDWVAAAIFLNSQMLKTPSEDTWLARRIAGPGLASEYYYQVRPELALVALQLSLEESALRIFQSEALYRANKPARVAHQELDRVLSPFATSTGLDSRIDFQAKILASVRAAEKEINQKTQDSLDFLQQIRDLGTTELHLVRLGADDLATVKSQATRMVERFYLDHIEKQFADSEHREQFWAELKLRHGDYAGLSEHFLAETFSDGFLTSLEAINPQFRIVVGDEPSIRKAAERVMDGVGSADAVLIDDTTPKPKDSYEVKPTLANLDIPAPSLNRASVVRCEVLMARVMESHH